SFMSGDKCAVAGAYHDHDFDFDAYRRSTEPTLATVSCLPREDIVRAESPPVQAWESFFHRHSDKATFFKKRRYLVLEFPELLDKAGEYAATNNFVKCRLLEIGCGYGSSLAAIMEANPDLICFACDLSTTALHLLDRALGDIYKQRLTAFICDVVKNDIPCHLVLPGSMDFVLMTFMLSAIGRKEEHQAVFHRAYAALRPGGLLLFRDYGWCDAKMVRSRNRIGQQLYKRADGTLAYFFTAEDINQLAITAGFHVQECKYATVLSKNRATREELKRVFVHAKLQRGDG
ncbi:methyltransferase family protein, partial [Nannochloropsis gaditana CCMP526]